MIKIVLSELLSRGLLWIRVLLIGGFLTADQYGYLLLLISAEAVFGSIVSYPQIKEILVRQEFSRTHFHSTTALYFLVLPFIVGVSYWYFESFLSVGVIAVSVLFFAWAQTALYVLRVRDAAVYNAAKILAAVVSTGVFFATLPFNQDLLPLSSLSYFFVLLLVFLRSEEKGKNKPRFSVRNVASGWAIFGFQALLTQLGQQGNRFVVGAVLSVADVAVFVKSYMLASGVTFVYAAVMIKYEKGLSRMAAADEVSARIRKAAVIGLGMVGLLVGYTAAVVGVWSFEAEITSHFFKDADMQLVLIFALYFALQAAYLVINPVVIATGARAWSLMATNVSLIVQVLVIAFYWSELTLPLLAVSMIAGQIGLLVILVAASLRFRTR